MIEHTSYHYLLLDVYHACIMILSILKVQFNKYKKDSYLQESNERTNKIVFSGLVPRPQQKSN